MKSYPRNFAPHPQHEAAVAAAQHYNRPHSIRHTGFAPTREVYGINTRKYYHYTDSLAQTVETMLAPVGYASDPNHVIANYYDTQYREAGGAL